MSKTDEKDDNVFRLRPHGRSGLKWMDYVNLVGVPDVSAPTGGAG